MAKLIRILFVCLFYILFSLPIKAQWRQVFPITDNFADVEVVSATQAFLVGTDYTRGAIYKTIDRGISWQRLQVPNELNLPGTFIATSFIDVDTGYVLSEASGQVLRTRNGGLNWSAVKWFNERCDQLAFVNASTGFVKTSTGKIHKTNDYGNSWTTVNGPVNNAPYSEIAFLSPQKFVAIYDGVLYRTSDAGTSWIGPTYISQSKFNHLYFANENVGFVYNGFEIFKTIDAGQNWELVGNMSNPTVFPQFMTYSELSKGVYLDTRRIHITTDIGYNFQQSFFTDNSFTWRAIDSYGDFICAIGDNALVLCSNDGGSNWAFRNFMPQQDELRDMRFFNDSTAIVVGSFPGTYRTGNGGKTWVYDEHYISEDNKYMVSLDPQKDTAYLEIGGSYVMASYDGGNSFVQAPNWQPPFLGHYSAWDYFLFSGREIFSVGTRVDTPVIAYSMNGGESWLRVYPSSPDKLTAITFPTWNTGFICGYNGKIMKTTDHGQSWIAQTTPVNNILTSLHCIDSTFGFSGGYGVLLRTTDGGEHWNRVETGFYSICKYVHFENDSIGFAFGSNGEISKSKDRGQTWTMLEPGKGIDIKEVRPMNDSILFAITNKKIFTVNINELKDPTVSNPTAQDKDLIVYPNPAYLKVRVSLKDGIDIAAFAIYDANGRLLRFRNLAGTNIIGFDEDVTKLPDGALLFVVTDNNSKRYTTIVIKR